MTQENLDFPPPPPPPPSSTRKWDMKFIALIVICVVLAASLVGVFAYYAPDSNLQSQIASKDAAISQLQQQVSNLTAQISNAPDVSTYQDQIANLNSQVATLNATISQYNDSLAQLTQDGSIISLASSQILLNQQPETVGNATDVYNNALPDAGYIVVQATSTSSTTYVQTTYSYSVGGINFNQTATLGTSGTAAFPVLPSTVDVKMGNYDNATRNSTVTITYYY